MKGTRPLDNNEILLVSACFDGAFEIRNRSLFMIGVSTGGRTSAHNSGKQYGRVHDTILFYSKSSQSVWNPIYTEHDPEYIQKSYRHHDERGIYRTSSLNAPGVTQEGESGKPWRGVNPSSVGRHWSTPRRGAWPEGVEPPENSERHFDNQQMQLLRR